MPTGIGKILYGTHVELFAFLPALLAASDVLSDSIYFESAGCVHGPISLNCCDMTVGLSRLQHGFLVALGSAEFNVFYRIWFVQTVYFWHFF